MKIFNVFIINFSILCTMLSCSDNKQYESVDLQMCNLYGNVRHCESYTNDCTNCSDIRDFTKAGVLVYESDNSDTPYKVLRNNKGFIVSVEDKMSGCKYKYDTSNRVVQILEWAESNTTTLVTEFDKENNILKEEIYGESYPIEKMNGSLIAYCSYEYLEKDSLGNWTKRAVDFQDLYSPEYNSKYIQFRKIQYYNPSNK